MHIKVKLKSSLLDMHTFMNRAFSFDSSTEAGTHEEDKAQKFFFFFFPPDSTSNRGEERNNRAKCEQVQT